jgi:hypothetical protein
MLRDLLEVMARPVCSLFCPNGMIDSPFGPFRRDFPFFEHLATTGAEIQGEVRTLKRSVLVMQKRDKPTRRPARRHQRPAGWLTAV